MTTHKSKAAICITPNQILAKMLRRLADTVESSEHEHACRSVIVGGETVAVNANAGPVFGPLCRVIFIGDASFVQNADWH